MRHNINIARVEGTTMGVETLPKIETPGSQQSVWVVQGAWIEGTTQVLAVFDHEPLDEELVELEAKAYAKGDWADWLEVTPVAVIPKCRCIHGSQIPFICQIHPKGDKYVK